MAHKEQFQYVESVKTNFRNFFLNKTVLEFGSLNINGSVRNFFENCCYIGLDLGPGPDVDVIGLAHEYDLPDQSFDVVLSTEMFEHDPHWKESFTNMIRLCKKEGLIFFTCASTGRKEHGTIHSDIQSSPLTVKLGWDYYRNLTETDFRKEFDFPMLFSNYEFTENKFSHDLYFWGIKQ